MTADFSQWIGREAVSEEHLTYGQAAGLCATMGRTNVPRSGQIAPLGAHWLLAPPRAPTNELDDDGHVRRGDFLPPVPAAKRMWAGSEVQFVAPLVVDALCVRRSKIANVVLKHGGSGPIWIVEVDHEVDCDGRPAVRERQTIVYMDGARRVAAPAAAMGDWDIEREILPDPVLLFRYSALTFNGHRIHYDRRYATEVEGYPDLVVHGPLIATLLLDLCTREYGTEAVAEFSFRARAPAYANQPLHLAARRNGRTVELAAIGEDRAIRTAAAVTYSTGPGSGQFMKGSDG